MDLLAGDPVELLPQLPSIPAGKQPPQCDYQDWDALNERADMYLRYDAVTSRRGWWRRL